MNKTLVIVESPSKAKTIEKYLGTGFTVRASIGHIRDLPKSNKIAIDIPGGFIPHYEVSKGKEKVIKELRDLSTKADNIILATDPDREGEAIAWHLQEVLNEKHKKPLTNIKRATFHEITKDAVLTAINHPREIDQDLRKAQEARRVLDRLVGYDLSGVIWKKVRYGLSAGRVQSPAMRILCEREREILAFIPEQYFVIEADLKPADSEFLTFTCSVEPTDKKIVDDILKNGKQEDWYVKDIKDTEAKRSPKPPFATSSLQQTASTRLGFSPSRTMQVAQKLYEAGHITYMRTDSTNLGTAAIAQISELIKKQYGVNYLENRVYKTKSKNAQEAHEAIRPTDVNKKNIGQTEEQKKLYNLIWERTVASQMVDARVMRSKITANIKTNSIPDFTVNGSKLIFDGFLKVDTGAIGEETILPKLNKDEDLKLVDLRDIEKFTQPPSRYTEAGLIKELEERGIGRPSTYASIMRTIEERGYVDKQGRTLFPTDTGMVVSGFLEEHFADYISDTFTAEMEDKLDEISEGKRDYSKTLTEFYNPFLKLVKEKDKLDKATNIEEAPDDILCPKCGKAMMVKLARNGKFYSCIDYPDCMGARKIDGTEMQGPKEIGRPCPKCGTPAIEEVIYNKDGSIRKSRKTKIVELGKLVLREGKFGNFISCSRYPKCKYIEEDEEEKKKRETGVKCPQCSDGVMSERRGRFGIFYSCSNYPDCKNAIKAKPTGNICQMCSSLMMDGTKTIPERCSNTKCPNHRPDKLEKTK